MFPSQKQNPTRMGSSRPGSAPDFEVLVTYVIPPKGKGPTTLVFVPLMAATIPFIEDKKNGHAAGAFPSLLLAPGGDTQMVSIFSCSSVKANEVYKLKGAFIQAWTPDNGETSITIAAAGVSHLKLTLSARQALFGAIPIEGQSFTLEDVKANTGVGYKFAVYPLASNGGEVGCPVGTARFMPPGGETEAPYKFSPMDPETKQRGPAIPVIGGGMEAGKDVKGQLVVNTGEGVLLVNTRVYDVSSTQLDWSRFGDALQTELRGEVVLVQNRKESGVLVQGDFPSMVASCQLRADMAATSRAVGIPVSWEKAKEYHTPPSGDLPTPDLTGATAVNLCEFAGDTSFVGEATARGWLEFWLVVSSKAGLQGEEQDTWMHNMRKFNQNFAFALFAMPTQTAPSQEIGDYVSMTGQIAARKFAQEPAAKRVRVSE